MFINVLREKNGEKPLSKEEIMDLAFGKQGLDSL